ncbi:MAG: hypothetical protein JO026_00965, partial [Patescibacteria group bacterium]|nr:hypothetical protein [Patescibacteria group bacterium]
MLFAYSIFPAGALSKRKGGVTMKTELPLVPFLAFGTVIALFTNFSPLSLAARATSMLFSGPL